MGQRHRKVEDQKSWPGLVLNHDFGKGRGLKPQIELQKCVKAGDVSSKLV